MKISAKEEYGFRCILQLANHKTDEPLTSPKIAAAEGISVPYVNKLMNILKHAGLVTTVRGNKGGYQLSKPANEINVAEVLKALDGSLFGQDFCKCFTGLKKQCVHFSTSCSIRSVWSVMAEQIEAVLSETTLGELVGHKETSMTQLLRVRSGEQAVSSAHMPTQV